MTSSLRRPSLLAAVVLSLIAVGCAARTRRPPVQDMNTLAESYVKLVLAVGEHDDGYVDAFYGPAEWRETVKAQKKSLPAIHSEAVTLIAEVERTPQYEDGTAEQLRRTYLTRQLQALTSWVEHLEGKRLPFDQESRAMYDAVAPTHPLESFQPALDALDQALPGTGPLHERYHAFRNRFVIPTERLDGVFQAAIAACRKKTAERIPLPEKETFVLEYVKDKPWSGYNWYQGNFHSLIQVNTELPIYIDRALDLACHEGYPGHHVYNALLEQTLVQGRGWVEFTVYPLYSPQSLIAEGSANYGVDLSFPEAERVQFEQQTLFPLAGLDPAGAANYYRIQELAEKVGYAANEVARRRLDQGLDDAESIRLLVRYALMSPERAAQRIKFIDHYRSYVINYNLGKDLVRQYVEARGGDSVEERWKVFTQLLSSPRLPSDLQTP